MSEPIYPEVDLNVIKSDGLSIARSYPKQSSFPGTSEAINEYELSIHYIVQ